MQLLQHRIGGGGGIYPKSQPLPPVRAGGLLLSTGSMAGSCNLQNQGQQIRAAAVWCVSCYNRLDNLLDLTKSEGPAVDGVLGPVRQSGGFHTGKAVYATERYVASGRRPWLNTATSKTRKTNKTKQKQGPEPPAAPSSSRLHYNNTGPSLRTEPSAGELHCG